MNHLVDVDNVYLSLNQQLLLHQVSFRVKKGEVFAVLGANGAGKSLLLDCIAGNLAHSGHIRFYFGNGLGLDKQKLGCLFNHFTSIPLLRVKEIIQWLSVIYNKPINHPLINQLNLRPLFNKPLEVLSKGENKKVGIYSALFHEPVLALLDEPTDGLDPSTRSAFWALIARSSTTIILTTHLWNEVEKTANRIVFIDQGHLLNSPTTPMTLLNEMVPFKGKIVVEQHLFTVPLFHSLEEGIYYIADVDGEKSYLYFTTDDQKKRLVDFLTNENNIHYSVQGINLQDGYLMLRHKNKSYET